METALKSIDKEEHGAGCSDRHGEVWEGGRQEGKGSCTAPRVWCQRVCESEDVKLGVLIVTVRGARGAGRKGFVDGTEGLVLMWL